jgi:hypothetical protein
VIAPLAPIQARPGKCTTLLPELLQADAEVLQESHAGFCDLIALVLFLQVQDLGIQQCLG